MASRKLNTRLENYFYHLKEKSFMVSYTKAYIFKYNTVKNIKVWIPKSDKIDASHIRLSWS